MPLWSSDGPSANPISQPAVTIVSDNDESAVAGLLALGTSTNDIAGPDSRLSDFGISPPPREVPMGQTKALSMVPGFATASSPDRLSQKSHQNVELSSTETMELLRHYRYEIAPWVSLFMTYLSRIEKLT